MQAEPRQSDSPWRQVVDDRRIILGGLFLVTLFLGLPLLWISRAFSPWEKLLYSVLVLIWSAIILAAFAAVMWWCYQQILSAY